MRKLAVLMVFLFAVVIFVPAGAEAETAEPEITSARAEVVMVEPETSVLVVRQHGAPGVSSYTDVLLNVVPETGISRGDEDLDLSGLKNGDSLTVEYRTDPSGESTAISIYLEASDSEPVEPSVDIVD